MVSKRERYFWKRGRVRTLANARAGAIQGSSDHKLSKKLEMYAESFFLTMDRNKANRIQKARREAREGKTVSLRSI
ncbi:hypothetical protein [Desulfosporosinus burensis]